MKLTIHYRIQLVDKLFFVSVVQVYNTEHCVYLRNTPQLCFGYSTNYKVKSFSQTFQQFYLYTWALAGVQGAYITQAEKFLGLRVAIFKFVPKES